MSTVSLIVYGITVSVTCPDEQILSWIEFDFRAFVSSAPVTDARVSVEAKVSKEPEGFFPPIPESVHAPEYVCFDAGAVRYVDYYNRAAARHDQKKESALFYGTDRNFLYEKLYLFICSRVGELLDKKGLHRVHGMAFSQNNAAYLFLIPMRGGKSTLALKLLQSNHFRLISDDTPLLNRRGEVLPFPMRIGVRDGEVPNTISKGALREFVRSQGDKKILVDTSSFGDRIESRTLPLTFLLCGRWTKEPQPSIIRVGKIRILKALFRDSVVGLGLPQVVEFFLRTPLSDTIPKLFIVLSRFRAAVAVTLGTTGFEFRLCPDLEQNFQYLSEELSTGRLKA